MTPTEQPKATEPEPTSPASQAEPEPTLAAEPKSTEITSADGGYRLRYQPVPAPIPLNDLLGFEIEVLDADGKPLSDVTLAVDAAMPGHGHGMFVEPEVEALGDGKFRAEGLLLHMPGYWEVYFDITRDGVTERAQFDIELE